MMLFEPTQGVELCCVSVSNLCWVFKAKIGFSNSSIHSLPPFPPTPLPPSITFRDELGIDIDSLSKPMQVRVDRGALIE